MADITPAAESVQVILVGSFNPAIFHPQWFLHQGMIGEEDALQSEVNGVSSEWADITFFGLRLQCTNERLSFTTTDIAYVPRLYDILLGVLINLPHIPCTACGINSRAHYKVSNVAYWHKLGDALVPKDVLWNDVLFKPGMLAIVLQGVREGDFPGNQNVNVEPSSQFQPGIFVQVNNHFPIQAKDSNSVKVIQRYVESTWEASCKDARRIGNAIFTAIPE